MSSMKDTPRRQILFVGSLPPAEIEDSFLGISSRFGGSVQSIPDGEPQQRQNFIAWQIDKFPCEVRKLYLGGTQSRDPNYQFTASSMSPVLYDRVALESYAIFAELKEQDRILRNVRFQVSIPTPFDCVVSIVRPEFQETAYKAYKDLLLQAIMEITARIPHGDLAIQLDMPFEIFALECERGRLPAEQFQPWFSPIEPTLVELTAEVAAVVPPEVKLGIHLCYGDRDHKHTVEPEDIGLMVDFTNHLVGKFKRRVDWVHMPVPKDRTDKEYFASLKHLSIGDSTLYLGLVHANDENGTRERIQQAEEVCTKPFGIATECGFGRTSPEDSESIFNILEAVS